MIATRHLVPAMALALLPGFLWAGGDPVRGERLAVQCVACHGVEGTAPNPTFPHLAGQNAGYLAIQLHDFRSGERFHPVMSPIARALRDQDIEDVSVYFESLPTMLGRASRAVSDDEGGED